MSLYQALVRPLAGLSIVLGTLGVSTMTGCAAQVGADATQTRESQALKQAVAGSYKSKLGHIDLRSDGTYTGGYAEVADGADNAAETLVATESASGVYSLEGGEHNSIVGLPLTHATIELRDATGAVTTSDLSVLPNGDLHVVRGKIVQIWTKQIAVR
jgi:hypothetical protein